MTKLRPPLSIDAALARIAGELPGSWAEMAIVAARAEHTVRAWGDQDKLDDVPVGAAIALDIAYRHAGGEGHPIFDVYRLRLELAEQSAFAAEACNARSASALVREGSEAVQAMIQLSIPGATPRDETNAVRQLEELVQVTREPLARLAAKQKPP